MSEQRKNTNFEKGGNPVEQIETKAERFSRLSTARTNSAIDAIRKLAALSNKSNYSYEVDDVEAIFAAIRAEVDRVESLYAARLSTSKTFTR